VIFAILFIKQLIYKETQKPPEVTMRIKRTANTSIFDLFSDHEIGLELKAISAFLDRHVEILDWVSSDLRVKDVQKTGRAGLPAECVMRCALLKQMRQLSYHELSFHLSDSASFQAFARLPLGWFPKKSVLQDTISRITPQSWERINHCVLQEAQQEKLENARTIRIDSTVTESNIHEPTDSSLLFDSMRVMTRLLKAVGKLPGKPVNEFVNHKRRAKRRAHEIFNTKGMDEKVPLYADLIKVTSVTLANLEKAEIAVSLACTDAHKKAKWQAEVARFKPLIQRVIDQTQRRVFNDEKVPAQEKLFSIFEDHTDIVIKGARDIEYGHKLNLSSGKSGLILDVVIEQGNPADTDRLLPMLERHVALFDQPPRQVAADGGYASGANLEAVKDMGVTDMAFNKKRGLSITDMAKSAWVYRQLKNFRAGIEAGISCLKRAYGLTRCTWKGLQHYRSFVWSSVVGYNLTVMARLRPV
jgi:IS5 family transposase